jgi:catechol 2,3-dioxygenase-like lactoylglutathione lyase family enzyme
MFKRIDHVEIIPSDYERTIAFYTGVLEFTIKSRIPLEAPPLEEIAYLMLGDTMIELIKVVSPAPPAAGMPVGYHGIALEVEDMDQAVEYLTGKGVAITWGPVDLGDSLRAEIQDPDGLIIELRYWK